MQKRTALRLATSAVAVAALAFGVVVAASGAGASPSRKAVANSKPAWLARATHLGGASQSGLLSLRVYLAPNGGLDALKSAVTAMSTPSSPSYRHFLSPAQYQAQYEPRTSAVDAVTSWLRSSGLTVAGVEAHHRYLTVTGTVAAAQKAFGVSLQRYTHDGQTVTAPATAPTVPSNVAGSVLSVSGLDTTVHTMTRASQRPPAGFKNATPCSDFYGQKSADTLPTFKGKVLPYAPCGYVGKQFRSAYEGSTTLNGSGVTVAITDAYAAPTIASDAATYASKNGDAPYAAGQFSQSVPKRFTNQHLCGPQGWFGEETLDVEAVHAMAGGADIKYYGAASCLDSDLLDTLAQVVDDHDASVVSNSWGDFDANETPDSIAAYEAVFLEGESTGISFVFSSGDDGDDLAATGLKQTDYPASDPFITAAGGTTDAIDANGKLAWQTGWGTEKYNLSADGTSWTSVGFLYGAGGGYSALFPRPDYQNGVVPSGAPAGRAVPDVALDSDPTTGMLVGETQVFPHGVVKYDQYRIGGTSLAAPLFAGMTALTIQNAGGGLGQLNPTIYAKAGSAFTDVKDTPAADAGNVRPDFVNSVDDSDGIVYSVRTFNDDSNLTIAPGWDDVTGVGSPNPGWLTSIR